MQQQLGPPFSTAGTDCMPEWMGTGDSWNEVAHIHETFFDPGIRVYDMVCSCSLHGVHVKSHEHTITFDPNQHLNMISYTIYVL